MVKKKYELILSMLKNERLTYFNQVKKNENQFQEFSSHYSIPEMAL